MLLPRYPIYVPSKGRAQRGYTARFLIDDRVPFRLVVEPSEAAEYARLWGADRVLILPWDGDSPERRAFCQERGIENGGLIAARNWIKEHSIAEGAERHWQLDDNIGGVLRRIYNGRRLPCAAGPAMRAIEDFTDRYENIAIAGMNYYKFLAQGENLPPFHLNCRVYSFSLILNSLPYTWRLAYNDDTDICLQVLAGGWCTVLFNAFCADKKTSMMVPGGNTDDLYRGDGRLRMARSLERHWRGVVSTTRKYGRPQHIVKDSWRRFDTPLKLKPGIDLGSIPDNDYGLRLTVVKEIRVPTLRDLVKEKAPPERGGAEDAGGED